MADIHLLFRWRRVLSPLPGGRWRSSRWRWRTNEHDAPVRGGRWKHHEITGPHISSESICDRVPMLSVRCRSDLPRSVRWRRQGAKDRHPEEYMNGRVVKAPTWIHGLNESRAGIAMYAAPRLGTPSYSQGWAPSVNWTDRATVDQTGQKTCVPVRCYEEVLVIAETSKAE